MLSAYRCDVTSHVRSMYRASVLLVLLVLHESHAAGAIEQALKIDLQAPIMDVSPLLWGIFFEEINHAGDGEEAKIATDSTTRDSLQVDSTLRWCRIARSKLPNRPRPPTSLRTVRSLRLPRSIRRRPSSCDTATIKASQRQSFPLSTTKTVLSPQFPDSSGQLSLSCRSIIPIIISKVRTK